MMHLRFRFHTVMALLFVLALYGCDRAEPSAAADTDADVATTIIEHSAGETQISGVPKRVVVLEWTYAEMLLAVGVQPVGLADVNGFRQWVDLPVQLSVEVVDIGTRQEPSLEQIMQLEPDLIIGTALRHVPIYETLSSIAPTLLFDGYNWPDGQLAEMQATFERIAKAVGRFEQGEKVWADFQKTIADARQAFEALPEADRQFVLVQMEGQPQTPLFRVFADNALAVQVLEQAGLHNAWPVEQEPYGFTRVGLEPLTKLGPVHFMHATQAGEMDWLNGAGSSIWSQMPFVKAQRVHALGGGVWLFGGPLSATNLVQRTQELLLPQLAAEGTAR